MKRLRPISNDLLVPVPVEKISRADGEDTQFHSKTKTLYSTGKWTRKIIRFSRDVFILSKRCFFVFKMMTRPCCVKEHLMVSKEEEFSNENADRDRERRCPERKRNLRLSRDVFRKTDKTIHRERGRAFEERCPDTCR